MVVSRVTEEGVRIVVSNVYVYIQQVFGIETSLAPAASPLVIERGISNARVLISNQNKSPGARICYGPARRRTLNKRKTRAIRGK